MSMQPPETTTLPNAQRTTASLVYLEQRLELLREHLIAVAEVGLDGDLDEDVARYRGGVRALRPVGDDIEALPSLERLRRRFDLSDFEDDVLLLALAPTVDTVFSELIGDVLVNVGRRVPDVGLALGLFSGSFADRMSHRSTFGPEGTLLRNHLLLLDQRGSRHGNLLELTLGL